MVPGDRGITQLQERIGQRLPARVKGPNPAQRRQRLGWPSPGEQQCAQIERRQFESGLPFDCLAQPLFGLGMKARCDQGTGQIVQSRGLGVKFRRLG